MVYHLGQPCQYQQRYDQQLVRNPFECLMGKLFKRSLPTKVILERILIETFTWYMIQLMLMMEYFSFNAVLYNNFALHDDCTLRKSVKSVRIQSYSGPYFDGEYLSVVSPNAGNYGPEYLQIRTLFLQLYLLFDLRRFVL